MYLFDKEDFNCNEIPSDWGDYATIFREMYDAHLKCINTYILDNPLPNKVLKQVNELNIKLNLQTLSVKRALSNLINMLSESICFDKSIYIEYKVEFDKFSSIAKEINIVLNTNGELTIIKTDINVDSTTIYPIETGVNPKTTKCVGVYMKQINNSSEFTGRVEIISGNFSEQEETNSPSDGIYYTPMVIK
jgi:hypothetical protein